MLLRPSRLAHVPASQHQVRQGSANGKRKIGATEEQESALVLTTEFNYNYRVFDGVWISYKEGGSKPLLTPVLTVRYLSPPRRPELCAVGALYLYSTRYLRDTMMDYDKLIPDVMIGDNVWAVADKPVEVTGARPSSAWRGVPVKFAHGKVSPRLPERCDARAFREPA